MDRSKGTWLLKELTQKEAELKGVPCYLFPWADSWQLHEERCLAIYLQKKCNWRCHNEKQQQSILFMSLPVIYSWVQNRLCSCKNKYLSHNTLVVLCISKWWHDCQRLGHLQTWPWGCGHTLSKCCGVCKCLCTIFLSTCIWVQVFTSMCINGASSVHLHLCVSASACFCWSPVSFVCLSVTQLPWLLSVSRWKANHLGRGKKAEMKLFPYSVFPFTECSHVHKVKSLMVDLPEKCLQTGYLAKEQQSPC